MVRILIIKPSSLGDVVHCFPAVEEIRRNVPDLRLDWVVSRSLAGLPELMPGVDGIIPFPRQAIGAGDLRALGRFLGELRRERYDLAIDFQGLLRSALMAFCSRSRRRVGFAGAREGAPLFYHRRIAPPAGLRHAVDRNVFLARAALGLAAGGPAPAPRLDLAEPLRRTEGLLDPPPERVPWVAVGFSSRWPSKNWPPEFFAEVLLAARRAVPELHCWLLGSAGERPLGDRIAAGLSPDWCRNLAGRCDLPALAGLLARSRALLTNDSGPMHLAAALRIPCVALFGATDPGLTGPYGEGLHAVVRSRCPRSPCFRRLCPRAPEGVRCSDGLSPGDVARRLAAALAGPRS